MASLIISIVTGGYALLVTLCKPIRQKLFNIEASKIEKAQDRENQRETDKCLLRDRITSIYFKHVHEKEMKEYEYENLEHLYIQYKNLGGNSFVDKIWNEVQTWRVIR